MFFYIVLRQYLPLPVFKVPAIRVNTTKSTYTFTSVIIKEIGMIVFSICLTFSMIKFLLTSISFA